MVGAITLGLRGLRMIGWGATPELPMPLSPDFQWTHVTQHDKGPPTVLMLCGEWIARLIPRMDGSWFAILACHRPVPAPLITRDCTSYERGVRGAEMWAARHEERLRREVGGVIANRVRHRV